MDNQLQKKVGLHQGVFFLAVIGLLFMPYALLTLEMTWTQLKALLIVYAWEAPLFAVICIGLPIRWVGALQRAQKAAAKKAHDTPAEMYRVISLGLKLPLKIARTILIIVLLAFSIGILQLIIFADFDRVQSIETLMIAIMIAVIYAACCFFNNERILAPLLGSWVEKFGMSTPPRVLTLFNKILVVCLSIMVVTILFQGSVTFSHSNRLIEGLRSESSHKELLQLKPILQKLTAEGKEKEVEKTLSNASKAADSDFFLLNKKGETPAGKKGILLNRQNPENLKNVFLNLHHKMDTQKPYMFHKNIEGRKIYYALPLDNEGLLLVKVIEFDVFRKEMTSLLGSILISSLLVLLITFYLSYRLAENASAPLKELEEVADRIADGDISFPVTVITGDEIGALSCSFLRMQRELSKLSQQANNIAGGDLTRQVEFKGDLGKAFNRMQTDLSRIIVQVREAILKISTACNQILASSEEQASGATEQAASVGETTAGIEELSATAGQISENSDIQAGMAESTQKNAEESADAMDEAVALISTTHRKKRRTDHESRGKIPTDRKGPGHHQ